MPIPTYDRLFNPLLSAIGQLGGSASISEQERVVAEILHLSEKETNEIHSGNRTRLSYRLAWARNYLKRYGLLNNSKRGIWSLTPDGLKIEQVDENEVKRFVLGLDRGKAKDEVEAEVEEEQSWEDELLDIVKQIRLKPLRGYASEYFESRVLCKWKLLVALAMGESTEKE